MLCHMAVLLLAWHLPLRLALHLTGNSERLHSHSITLPLVSQPICRVWLLAEQFISNIQFLSGYLETGGQEKDIHLYTAFQHGAKISR